MKMKMTNEQKRLANCERAVSGLVILLKDYVPPECSDAIDKFMMTFFYTALGLGADIDVKPFYYDELKNEADLKRKLNETNP